MLHIAVKGGGLVIHVLGIEDGVGGIVLLVLTASMWLLDSDSVGLPQAAVVEIYLDG